LAYSSAADFLCSAAANILTFGAFVLNFEHLNFGFVSDFDIRISDLLVLT